MSGYRPIHGTSTDPAEFQAMLDGEMEPAVIPDATPTADGKLVAADKAKLDALDPTSLAAADAAAEQLANKNTANGYAGLNASSRVDMVRIAAGSFTGTEFVRGDGVLADPPSGGGGGAGNVVGSGVASQVHVVPVVNDLATTTIIPTPVVVDPATGDISGARDVAIRHLNPTGLVDGRDVSVDGIALDAAVSGLASEISTRASADSALTASLASEASTRAAADSSEASTRAAADVSLQGQVTAEASTRAAADNSLQSQLTTEATTRAAADTAHAASVNHPLATQSSQGMMSSTDKALVDTIAGLQELLRAAGVDSPEDLTSGEVLWSVSGRWRAGRPTTGFAQAHFYCETPGTFGDGGTCELYCPIGAPNSTSSGNNWPAEQDDLYLLSYEWETGIPYEDNTLVDAATLDVFLFGFVKSVGGGVPFYVTLDPDGDVRVKEDGNEVAAFKQTQLVLGAESGVRVGTPATISNSGGEMLFTLAAHGLVDDQEFWPTDALSKDGVHEGAMPDLENGQRYYVVVVGADTWKASRVPSTDPAFPDIVAWNPTGGLNESNQYLITQSPGAGSIKRLRFGFLIETAIDVYTPMVFHARLFADGRGSSDGEDGMHVTGELHLVPHGEQVGPWQFVSARENNGTHWWQSFVRTTPGTAIGATPVPPTATPLVRAKGNYDGSGNHAYYTTAFDYGGNWDEVQLTADLGSVSTTLPMRSFLDNHVEATGTALKVGGVIVGEVLEYKRAQRLLRYRYFDTGHRIEPGDVVTWELHRRIGGSMSATIHQTGTFTAGAVRAGPQPGEIGVRIAVGGAQDGTTVVDVRGGLAFLRRHRSR